MPNFLEIFPPQQIEFVEYARAQNIQLLIAGNPIGNPG
jgi:hypothetical protein